MLGPENSVIIPVWMRMKVLAVAMRTRVQVLTGSGIEGATFVKGFAPFTDNTKNGEQRTDHR